jgi:thiamine-monophosphate kinase
MAGGEFALIRRWFAGFGAGDDVLLGVGDDAAVLRIPEGQVLHASTDTLIAGRHFPIDTLPEDVGYRAVATAASDLAAMGAEPLGMTLALTLPGADELWLHGFSQGLAKAAKTFSLPLVGGDTTRGSLNITITVLGYTPAGRWLSREGASPGDQLYVSGTVGDAAMALAILSGDIAASQLPGIDEVEQLTRRFTHPEPRIALGAMLREVATSAIDLSDGLLGDAAHIANASGVELVIDSASLPLSEPLQAFGDRERALGWALTGGDDYELLFTLPEGVAPPPGCTRIGDVRTGHGVICDREPEQRGYDHFNY